MGSEKNLENKQHNINLVLHKLAVQKPYNLPVVNKEVVEWF